MAAALYCARNLLHHGRLATRNQHSCRHLRGSPTALPASDNPPPAAGHCRERLLHRYLSCGRRFHFVETVDTGPLFIQLVTKLVGNSDGKTPVNRSLCLFIGAVDEKVRLISGNDGGDEAANFAQYFKHLPRLNMLADEPDGIRWLISESALKRCLAIHLALRFESINVQGDGLAAFLEAQYVVNSIDIELFSHPQLLSSVYSQQP